MQRVFVRLFLTVTMGAALMGCALSRSTASRGQAPEEITLVTARPDIVQQPDEFMMVDVMPRLIGGVAGLRESVIYPEHLKASRIEGEAIVQLIVDEEGALFDLQVIRSVHPELDKIALEAISKARFIPGRIGNEPVSVQIRVPVQFRVPD